MSFTDKDFKTMINKPNKVIDGRAIARAYMVNMPASILNWYEKNSSEINAEVVIVRNKSDESAAAIARNSGKNILFLFAEYYPVSNYFSGTSHLITFSKALMKRAG